MKKIKSWALPALICILSVIFAIGAFGCSPKLKTGEVEKAASITVKDGRIRVLQLTDLHLTTAGSLKQDAETFRWVEQAIFYSRPDVVAVTGDTVAGGNKGRNDALIRLANLFEEKKVYWMYTFGNHDGEWSVASGNQVGKSDGVEGREELYDLLKGYEYSLMRRGDTDGVGNYVVDVQDEAGKILYAFVNMDSHGKLYDNDKDVGYIGLKADQVDWYRREMEALRTRSGGMLPESALFMHVPLYQYYDAYANYGHVGGFEEHNLEWEPCAPTTDIGMFDAIVDLGSTKLVSVGHDHDFNWLRDYGNPDDASERVYLSYGRCSGVDAWQRRTPVGATVFDIFTQAPTREGRYKVSVIEPTFDYSEYSGF